MRDEEKDVLRARVGTWLDVYEIIQTEAQGRGLSVQDAKELARSWVAVLIESPRTFVSPERQLEEAVYRQREDLVRQQQQEEKLASQTSGPYPYRWQILPILPNTSGSGITWSISSNPKTDRDTRGD